MCSLYILHVIRDNLYIIIYNQLSYTLLYVVIDSDYREYVCARVITLHVMQGTVDTFSLCS